MSRPDTYESWKASAGTDVRVSGWVGFLIGAVLLCLIWAIPVYVVAAVLSDSVTLAPNTPTELVVAGVTWLVLMSLLLRNRRARPDHYETSLLNR